MEEDFPPECEIVVDQINNAVMLKKRPATVPAKAAAAAAALAEGKDTRKRRRPATSEGRQQEEGEVYILPTDRNHKPIAKRYTTARCVVAKGSGERAVVGLGVGVLVVACLSAYVSSDVLTGGMGAAVVVVMNQGGVGHRGLCVQRRGGDRGRAAGEQEKVHQAGRVDDAPQAYSPLLPPLASSRLD